VKTVIIISGIFKQCSPLALSINRREAAEWKWYLVVAVRLWRDTILRFFQTLILNSSPKGERDLRLFPSNRVG
jgi:hypothetical protein